MAEEEAPSWGLKEAQNRASQEALVKNPPAMAEDWKMWGLTGSGRSPGRKAATYSSILVVRESHGQSGAQAGYSLWGHKELDMASQLSTMPRNTPVRADPRTDRTPRGSHQTVEGSP